MSEGGKSAGSGKPSLLKLLASDAPSGVVVALVALPLCLGIALASGAPLLSGLITGIVGGVVVALLSGSPLSVSGPAAGLTVIVLAGIEGLGYPAFLTAVVLSGIMQIGFGLLRGGVFGYYVPAAVIRGMLAAIGFILILKQVPHLVGFNADYMGDADFSQADGRNTFTEIPFAIGHMHAGSAIIGVVSLVLLFISDKLQWAKRVRWAPAPLIVVSLGIGLNYAFGSAAPDLQGRGDLLVSLPTAESGGIAGQALTLWSQMQLPDVGAITNSAVWTTAITIAIVASIETLLCVEAIDKLDPLKRESDTNRELFAQGVGNAVAGALGGIPMTAVIVRGSANVQSGAQSRLSSFVHGVLLVMSVLVLPHVLNLIPLASLAAILLHVGYKLAPLTLIKEVLTTARSRALAFGTTFLGILFTDLLIGVALGSVVSVFFILRASTQNAFSVKVKDDPPDGEQHMHRHIILGEHVPFLAKAQLRHALAELPNGSFVQIDASETRSIDADVVEVLHDFEVSAPDRNITVELRDVPAPVSLGGHGQVAKKAEKSADTDAQPELV